MVHLNSSTTYLDSLIVPAQTNMRDLAPASISMSKIPAAAGPLNLQRAQHRRARPLLPVPSRSLSGPGPTIFLSYHAAAAAGDEAPGQTMLPGRARWN